MDPEGRAPVPMRRGGHTHRGHLPGLAASSFNHVRGALNGLSVGVVNYAWTIQKGIQIGIVNIVRDNPKGLRVLPVFNAGF